MRNQSTSLSDVSDRLLNGVFWSIALNTVIPVTLYQVAKTWFSASELTALACATLYPILESVWELARFRRLDPIAIVVLLGIFTDAGALALGGSPKLLLLRESIFTGAFGFACFVSLLLPRPLMFYFGRHFMSGGNPAKRMRYEASWQLPEVRRGNRLVTTVWGVVFVGELLVRIGLIEAFSATWVLIVSPLLLGTLTVATVVWSLAYAQRMRTRALPAIERLMSGGAAPVQPPIPDSSPDSRLDSIQPPPSTRSS